MESRNSCFLWRNFSTETFQTKTGSSILMAHISNKNWIWYMEHLSVPWAEGGFISRYYFILVEVWVYDPDLVYETRSEYEPTLRSYSSIYQIKGIAHRFHLVYETSKSKDGSWFETFLSKNSSLECRNSCFTSGRSTCNTISEMRKESIIFRPIFFAHGLWSQLLVQGEKQLCSIFEQLRTIHVLTIWGGSKNMHYFTSHSENLDFLIVS